MYGSPTGSQAIEAYLPPWAEEMVRGWVRRGEGRPQDERTRLLIMFVLPHRLSPEDKTTISGNCCL